ncbi:Uncharacterised protein [Salmonella bongori]|nr:Uncharacterised protein [Salmonella bongori]
MYQLSAIRSGNIGYHKVFYRLIFGIAIVIGAARQTNTDPQLILPLVQSMRSMNVIGNQDVAVVNRDIPLNGVSLQVAKTAMRNPRPIHLVMETLPQNGVVGVGNGDIINDQIAHYCRFFTANENLRDQGQNHASSRL